MIEVFATVEHWAVVIFAASSMFSVGLANPLRTLLEPLRKPARVIRALVVNFILVPAGAYLIASLGPLPLEQKVGLFAVACAAGAPFLLTWVQVAGGDRKFAASLLILLLPITVFFVPVVIPLALPGAHASAGALARPLVTTMLLPLAIGLAIRPQLPRLSAAVLPWTRKLSSIALVALLVGTVVANWSHLTRILTGASFISALILILGAFVIGYTLGGRAVETRNVVALGAAQRNIAASTVVATETFGGGDVLVTVVFISVLGMLVLFPLSRLIRARGEGARVGGWRGLLRPREA